MAAEKNASIKSQNKSARKKLLKKNLRKFMNNKLAIIGAVCMAVILIAAIVGPWFCKYDPNQIDLAFGSQPPSGDHWFGTDKLGRDLFARCLAGGRVSILVGLVGAAMGSLIGAVLGALSGYFGGKVDALIIRLSELFQTFPQMVLVMVMVAVMGRGLSNLLLIFSITGWMTTCRMVRNEFISLREETYVKVCEAFGMSKAVIMFKQILPNVINPIIVSSTVNVAGFILQEASLSFLGIGVSDSTATWGNILNAATSLDIVTNYWWLWMLPAAVVTIFVLAVNFFGDGLRDVLDPKQQ